MTRAEREEIYAKALKEWGFDKQAIVAVEELSEAQKEICKMVRGIGDRAHLAEEIADARIMLEQMELFCNARNSVADATEYKLNRLAKRLCHD